MMRGWLIAGALAGIGWAALAQDVPPARLNYQGVLRGVSGTPLSGPHDMVFRFHGSSGGADAILIDSHTAASGGAVTVVVGLFNVQLGSGVVSDGPGPGTYTSLEQVFRDYAYVYVEVQIGAEVLLPRTRLLSAAYALNAAYLEGRTGSAFLDTSGAAQTKTGQLILDNNSAGYGVEARGVAAGGYFADKDGSGIAYAAYGAEGVRALGDLAGGYFEDSNGSGYVYAGYGGQGIWSLGNSAGGYFECRDGSGSAHLGYGSRGVEASGSDEGGYFEASGGSGFVRAGNGDYGIEARGNTAGGYFKDRDSSGYAYIGYGDRGISAYGNAAGGYLQDADSGGEAWLGYAEAVEPFEVGIAAYGPTAGGYFSDTDSVGYAYLGYGDYGVRAYGNTAGGYFVEDDTLGTVYAGYGDRGIQGAGLSSGGLFGDGASYAYLGVGDDGALASAGTPGFFQDTDSSAWAEVGEGEYKIRGSGTASFVQNHPSDRDRVIVYAAPEGAEVAVYTRGTARLASGEAHVPLGETFAFVANPDTGLTALVTPREVALPLAVAAVTPHELVVRAPADSPAEIVFDYLVYGLRAGFEEFAIVRDKTQESPVPSMASHRRRYERLPDLAHFSARERFRAMAARAGTSATTDLTASRALVAAIGEYDPQADGRAVDVAPPGSGDAPLGSGKPSREGAGVAVREAGPPAAALETVAVSEPVAAGDVLVLDPRVTGSLKRGDAAGDTAVVGIVAEPEQDIVVSPGHALLLVSGIAPCNVDASFGPIRAGDLLGVSPTAGHAMRVVAPAPGTVLGKALQPLAFGRGTISVLVAPF